MKIRTRKYVHESRDEKETTQNLVLYSTVPFLLYRLQYGLYLLHQQKSGGSNFKKNNLRGNLHTKKKKNFWNL